MRNIIIFLLLILGMTNACAAGKLIVIPEVHLQLNKTIANSRTTSVPSTSITRADMAASSAINVYDLLQQQQSIIRLGNSSGIANQTTLSLRGFGDNAAANTLILIDGLPWSNPSLLAPNLDFIAISDLERIDILPGSQGSLWGDQAVGGVVNIITRHPQRLAQTIKLGLGNLNQQWLSASLANRDNNGRFFKGAFFTYQTDHYRQHNEQQNQAGFIQTGLDYAQGSLSVNLQAYNSHTDIPIGLTAAQYDSDPRQSGGSINTVNYQTRASQLFNKQELSNNWLLETGLASRQIKGNGFVYRYFQRQETQHDFKPRLLGKFGKNNLIIGYDWQHSNYQIANNLVNDDVTTTQQSLYAQTLIPLGQYLDVTLGGRTAWQQHTIKQKVKPLSHAQNRVWVSEQSLNLRPHPAWRFFLRRDGNFSFAKANQQTWTTEDSSTLLPQVGVSYEAGLCWTNAQHSTQFSLYQLDLHHEIAFDPAETAMKPFGTYRNFDQTRRRGFMLSERYRWTSQLLINLQFNYVTARFNGNTFAGKTIPAVPAINSNLGFHYQMTPQWHIQYHATYIGSRYASEDNANVSAKLPSYWLNAIGIQYTLKGFKAGMNITNLFNQCYPIYTLFNPDSAMKLYYPGAGRTFLVTLGVEL